MKKAAVVSMIVLAAVAVAALRGKPTRIAASPEENTGEEAAGGK